MNGAEFLKNLRRLGRKTDTVVRFDPKKGKGSHGAAFYGTRRTTLKDLKKEIRVGLFRKMCKDLGIDPKDLK